MNVEKIDLKNKLKNISIMLIFSLPAIYFIFPNLPKDIQRLLIIFAPVAFLNFWLLEKEFSSE